MTISWPYRSLLLALLLACAASAVEPCWALRDLAQAVASDDADRLARRADVALLRQSAATLLDAELRLQRQDDMGKSPLMAWRDYLEAKKNLDQEAKVLSQPKGLARLLLGELDNPAPRDPAADARWIAGAALNWIDPLTIRAELRNPATGWHTNLTFQRLGVFDWRLVGLSLPVEAILDRLVRERQLNLKKALP